MASGPGRFTGGRGYRMLKIFIIFHLLVFLLHGPAVAGDHLSGILKGIQKNYGNLPGLTIRYTREVITRSMSLLGNQVKGDLAAGRIYFKSPYFLRLEQETPQSETIIANGDTFWWYIPDKKCAYQYSTQEFGKELRLLSDIFRGLIQVEESFQVEIVAHATEGEHQIVLRPDPPWQEIDRIALIVTTRYDIRVVDVHNQLGTVTRFRLKDLTKKERFEKDFFNFSVPEGVQVVQEKGG